MITARKRTGVVSAWLLVVLALLLSACGGDELVNKTNRNKAVADARSSFGIIREAMVAYFKKHGEIPEKCDVVTLGVNTSSLRFAWYTEYKIEVDGDKEDAFKGTKVIAVPKEGTVAPEMTMKFESLKTGENTIRE
jgi:hypothetical protein